MEKNKIGIEYTNLDFEHMIGVVTLTNRKTIEYYLANIKRDYNTSDSSIKQDIYTHYFPFLVDLYNYIETMIDCNNKSHMMIAVKAVISCLSCVTFDVISAVILGVLDSNINPTVLAFMEKLFLMILHDKLKGTVQHNCIITAIMCHIERNFDLKQCFVMAVDQVKQTMVNNIVYDKDSCNKLESFIKVLPLYPGSKKEISAYNKNVMSIYLPVLMFLYNDVNNKFNLLFRDTLNTILCDKSPDIDKLYNEHQLIVFKYLFD